MGQRKQNIHPYPRLPAKVWLPRLSAIDAQVIKYVIPLIGITHEEALKIAEDESGEDEATVSIGATVVEERYRPYLSVIWQFPVFLSNAEMERAGLSLARQLQLRFGLSVQITKVGSSVEARKRVF